MINADILNLIKDVTINGDEMIFSISIETNAREERLNEKLDVNGTTLVFQTGKLEFEALEVSFECRVPLVTEVRKLRKNHKTSNLVKILARG